MNSHSPSIKDYTKLLKKWQKNIIVNICVITIVTVVLSLIMPKTFKAVAVLMTNPGKGVDYRGFDKVKIPGVPVIAIPTTAGTGSEVTINAVFTNKQEQKKLGINGNFLNATYAILDAEWTLSCPFSVALSSGLEEESVGLVLSIVVKLRAVVLDIPA